MNIKQVTVFKIIVLLALVNSFCSCTIEKRRYFKGYDIEWKQSNPKIAEQKQSGAESVAISNNTNAVSSQNPDYTVPDANANTLLIKKTAEAGAKKHISAKPVVKLPLPVVASSAEHPVVNEQGDNNNQGHRKLNADDKLLITGGILGDISVILFLVSYYVFGATFMPFMLIALILFVAGSIFVAIGSHLHQGRGMGIALVLVYALVIAVMPFIGIYLLVKQIINSGSNG